MDNTLIQFQPGHTWIESFNGASRVIFFVGNVFLLLIGMDIRIILPMLVLNAVLLAIANPGKKRIGLVVWAMIIFNLINILMFYLVNPTIGNTYTDSYTLLFKFNDYFVVTLESLYYFAIRLLKIFSIVIATLWFVTTITPSELSAGLNALGLSSRMCMVISLAFRFIPDIAIDYKETKLAMELRGMEFDADKVSLTKRLKQSTFIILPLIVLSFENVKSISNAMDLRGFGNAKKRSYYCERPNEKRDYLVQGLGYFLMILSLFVIYLRVTNRIPEIWFPF